MTTLFRPFTLTHVVYAENDIFGLLFAIFSLLPLFVIVVYVTLIFSRRDMRTLFLLLGQLLDELLNDTIKGIVQQPRPQSPATMHVVAEGIVVGGEKLGYGMPSAHSQFSFFAATAISLWALRRWRIEGTAKLTVIGAMYFVATMVAVSRVYLGYHSTAQILVGSTAGVLSGAVWTYITEKFFVPRFSKWAGSPIGRALRCRDTTYVEDVVEVEYRAVKAHIDSLSARKSRPENSGWMRA